MPLVWGLTNIHMQCICQLKIKIQAVDRVTKLPIKSDVEDQNRDALGHMR